MLNRAEILNSLGYLKSSVGYQMADAFLNSHYIQIIEQEMLGKIRDEKLRFDAEHSALELKLRDPNLSQRERKNIAHAMTAIMDKINSLQILQEGIEREIAIQLKAALITALPNPNNLVDSHSPLDQRHLKRVIEDFHSRKVDGSNKKVGFKKSTTQLIDAQAAFLGVERRGLLGFLKHVLGGLLTGLGVGLPLLSKSFRNVFFSTKSQKAVKASYEAVKGEFKRGVVEVPHRAAVVASIETLNARVEEAEQRLKEVYTLLERKALVDPKLREAMEELNDMRIHSVRNFRPDISTQSLQKDITPIEEAIVALKRAIPGIDEIFSSVADQDNPAVNTARTKLANLLRFEQFVEPLAPKSAAPAPR